MIKLVDTESGVSVGGDTIHLYAIPYNCLTDGFKPHGGIRDPLTYLRFMVLQGKSEFLYDPTAGLIYSFPFKVPSKTRSYGYEMLSACVWLDKIAYRWEKYGDDLPRIYNRPDYPNPANMYIVDFDADDVVWPGDIPEIEASAFLAAPHNPNPDIFEFIGFEDPKGSSE